jgi:hypothetical protein
VAHFLVSRTNEQALDFRWAAPNSRTAKCRPALPGKAEISFIFNDLDIFDPLARFLLNG